MRRLARRGVLVLALAAPPSFAGCGSSPEPVFYALAPTRGVTAPLAIHAIRIRRPGLAGYLDRPEIVRGVVDFRLGVTSNERWGEPLDAMLGRVLAEDLDQRVPGSSVYTEDGAITADPEATVEVDFRRFDIGSDGQANLWAEVAVQRGDNSARATSRSVKLSQAPAAATTSALVATMSDLLGQLADQIAAMLRGT
jgi:uncharacterized lipoprotein YmbA